MALSDFQSSQTIARSRRGTVNRNLGGKPVTPTKAVEKKLGIVGQAVDKAALVGRQTGNIAAAGARYAKNTVVDVYQAGHMAVVQNPRDFVTKSLQNRHNYEAEETLNRKRDQLIEGYRTGSISRENYTKELQDLSKSYSDISREAKKVLAGPTPQERAMSVVETGVNLLSVSTGLGLTKVGAAQAAQMGSKQGVKALVQQGATNLERQILRVPVVRALVERNLAAGAKRIGSQTLGEYVAREGAHIAAGLLIKRPIFYQTNIADAKKVYEGIVTGDYPQAIRSSAWLGIQMIEGGPLGLFSKGYSFTKGKVHNLVYGRGSFIDELSKRIGDGNSAQVARFLTTTQEKAPKEFKRIEKAFRVFQESNLRMTDNDVGQAVDNFLRTYTDAGMDLTKVTPSQIYKDMRNWQLADEVWAHAAKSGALKMNPEYAARFTPVRWDSSTRTSVADAVRAAGDDPQAQLAAVEALTDAPAVGFGNNSNLMLQVKKIIGESQTAEDAARGIQAIDAAAIIPNSIPKGVANRLAKLGYTIAAPEGGRVVSHLDLDDTRKLVSGAINGTNDLFDEAIAPQPQLNALARQFESFGVSPRDSNTFAYRELGRSVAIRLNGTTAGTHFGFRGVGDEAKGGQAILSKLKQYVESKPAARGLGRLSSGRSAVTDIRQLTIREVQDALGEVSNGKWVKLGRSEAKEVSRAIAKGYMDVPLELRGLGEKIIDALYVANPAQKYYSRIQSALRYTYNPFFRVQERTETAILARAQANNLIWGKARGQLDDAVRVLDDNRIFSGVLPGEAAQDQVLGRITANLTNGQKRDLAGLALDVSEVRGIPLERLAKEFPDEIDDALRVVVQYPRKGVLASPLARTLNLVFFPLRYNAKVTTLAVQTLAKQPPAIQKAVLHSAFQLRPWLKSDEGIRWQSENADAIQLFKWITPVGSIESTFKLLTGTNQGLGDVGLLGGLPLGFITQILDGQGIIDINKPYVNPKTGDVFPDYIPASAKARAATALGDLLNSMFTYPGRILGLPGKEKTTRDLIKKIIETEGADFDKRLNEAQLTPVQQAWVRVLKDNAKSEDLDALYTSPAPGQFNWYTLPPQSLPIRPAAQSTMPEVKRRTNLPKKAKKGAKTKKTAKPMALPMP